MIRPLIAAALAAPLFASPLAAQSATSPQDRVVVSASRIEEPGYGVGSTLSVIDGADIERRQIRFVADALRDVPGLAVNRSGPTGNLTQLRVRGSEANMTLVLVDGVQVNDPGNFDGGFDFANLLALDIDRIEILRGAQSAIWGSDAIGGVVNIVTRSEAGPTRLFLSMEGGSFGTTALEARAQGGNARVQAAFGAGRFDTDGISAARAALGNSERDPFTNNTAHGRLSVKPVENLRITLAGRIQRSEVAFDNPPFDADNVTRSFQRWGNASAALTLLDGKLETLAQACVLDTALRSDFSGFPGTSDGDKRAFSYQATLKLASGGSLPARHRLTALVERERDTGRLSFAGDNEARVTRNTGFAGEYQIALAERFFLTAGTRHDANDRFDDATTYRLAAALRLPAMQTRVHGSYGTGFKAPTLVELFGFAPCFAGNPDLEPETSRSYDLGLEHSLIQGRVRVDVTLFENRIDNRIEGAGPFAVNVQGVTRVRGIEVEGDAEIVPGLRLALAYTAMETQDPTGAELIRRPRHVASGNLSLDLPRIGLTLDLGVNYNGRARDRDFSFFPAPTVDLAPYTLVTLAAALAVSERVALHARIENAFDQDYEEVLFFGSPGIAAYGGLALRFGG